MAAPAIGPVVLADARVWIAGLALLLYAALVGRLPRTWRRWRQYLLLAVLNAAIPFTLIAIASLELTASLTAILNATTPLFTALVAAVWLREPLGLRRLLWLLLGIAGVGVVVGFGPLAVTPALLLAAGASLLASSFYGLGGVYARVAFRGVPPLDLAVGQQLGAALLLTLPAVATLPMAPLTPIVALCVVALALLSTALGFVLYFHLLAVAGPTSTSSVTFLIPVFGLLLGALFLREPLGPGMFLGLAIILLSIVRVTRLRLPARLGRLARLGGAGARLRMPPTP